MALKIGISSCLLGNKCNFDGKDLLSAFVKSVTENPQIEVIHFCPEDAVFGTPRPNLRIVGGVGEDVLEGRAVVIDQNGIDVTQQQISGAQQFLNRLAKSGVKYAILMDGSPSCGSNVLLSEDNWPQGGFKRGAGVAAALLRKSGIKVFSGYDERDVSEFIKSLINDVEFPEGLKNLRDFPRFKPLFL